MSKLEIVDLVCRVAALVLVIVVLVKLNRHAARAGSRRL